MKGPNPDVLPDDAAGRAGEVLGGIQDALAGGVKAVGETLADLLPAAVALLVDIAGVVG